VPYAHRRASAKDDPQDSVTFLARSVIAEAVTDWRLARKGHVLSAALANRWQRGHAPDVVAEMQQELRDWFTTPDPHGLAWWCELACLDVTAVREAVGVEAT
jgi:hypothetical protein